MRDVIEVDKTLMPYNFDIELADEEFNLEFLYNKKDDLFTVTLSKDEEVLVYNEPIVYGVELFKDVYENDLYPRMSIIPYDESCEENEVTYENFGKTVFLTIDNDLEQ